MSDEPTLTTAEAAALLRRSPKRLRQLVAAGRLRHGEHFVRPGGDGYYLWKRDALIRYRDGGEPAKAQTDLAEGDVVPLASRGIRGF